MYWPSNATRPAMRCRQAKGSREDITTPLIKDEQLASRAGQGDHWATEELVRRYQQKAYEIAYHMCSGDREEARDLTQEAFLRTFKNIRTFRGDASFYTWFYRIVVNTCLDAIRRRRLMNRVFFWRSGQWGEGEFPEEIGEGNGNEMNPLTILSGKQMERKVREVLAALPDKQRLAFQFKVFHGMKIREIAQVLGTAEGTVKSHLFRATQSLREALRDWAEP